MKDTKNSRIISKIGVLFTLCKDKGNTSQIKLFNKWPSGRPTS